MKQDRYFTLMFYSVFAVALMFIILLAIYFLGGDVGIFFADWGVFNGLGLTLLFLFCLLIVLVVVMIYRKQTKKVEKQAQDKPEPKLH